MIHIRICTVVCLVANICVQSPGLTMTNLRSQLRLSSVLNHLVSSFFLLWVNPLSCFLVILFLSQNSKYDVFIFTLPYCATYCYLCIGFLRASELKSIFSMPRMKGFPWLNIFFSNNSMQLRDMF